MCKARVWTRWITPIAIYAASPGKSVIYEIKTHLA